MLKTVNILDVKIPGLNILSKIGEGGMSQVYLAEQISLKRKVAVKVMRLEISENELDVQRFKHEAKTIAQLDHPNIINIYNIGQTSKGEVFYTMPYLNHGDFSNYIIENEQEFIQLLKSICDGLAFAHDRGVIHRDIKPENLLFDEFGYVRIADFGIAITKNGTRMTKEHQIVGSAQYMSPEQARSLKVDNHTDIYSLGIVIYERLTGKVPFDSDESISILVNHVSTKPPRLPPKMRHWQKLIDKCLAKNPNDRYQSMIELKIDLEKIPINSIQRTNTSITNVLESTHGKHLKWFIPALMLMVIMTYMFTRINNPVENLNNIENSVVENKKNSPAIVSRPNVDTSLNSSNTDVSKNPTNEKQLSTDEIKNIIASQNMDFDEKTSLVSESQIKQNHIQELIDNAHINIENYQLSMPKDNNATDQLLQVLDLDPENTEAKTGLENIGQKYFQLINSALNKQDFMTALKHSKSFISFNLKSNNINSNFGIQNQAILENISSQDLTVNKISANNLKTIIKIVKLFSPNDTNIAKLEGILKFKTGPQVGEKLLDEMGIETILVSKDLSVTTKEISVSDYTAFASATDRSASRCKHEAGGLGGFFSSFAWNKLSFQTTATHPVVCISQSDAQAYSEWLSEQTENRYRLPSKQEWLFLAAENNNPFTACKSANTAGSESKKSRVKNQNYPCSDQFEFTAPVASFTNNNFGLYDLQGNVSEWLYCEQNPCDDPVALGSSWYDGKMSNKLDLENNYKTNYGYTHIGFRLVRDL